MTANLTDAKDGGLKQFNNLLHIPLAYARFTEEDASSILGRLDLLLEDIFEFLYLLPFDVLLE